MLVVVVIGLLGKGLDGAAQAALVAAASVLAVIAAVGAVPVRATAKDYSFDFGEFDRAAGSVEDLADHRPLHAAAAVAGEPERVVVPETDLTVPLFASPQRRLELLSISPKAALLAVFGEVEEQLRGLARDAGLEADHGRGLMPVRRLVQELGRSGWLTAWHVDVLEQITRARNQAAHAPGDLELRRDDVARLVDAAAEVAGDVAQRRLAAREGVRPD